MTVRLMTDGRVRPARTSDRLGLVGRSKPVHLLSAAVLAVAAVVAVIGVLSPGDRLAGDPLSVVAGIRESVQAR